MARDWGPGAVAECDIRVLPDAVAPAPGWLFILGLPRSGTNVLTQVLSAHPDAAIAREAWLWGYWTVLTTGRFDLLVPAEWPHQWWIENARMLEAVGLSDEAGPLWPASRVREFFEGLRETVAPGVRVFGDKGPHYRPYLDELRKVFPECKLVVCVRDSWDRAASMMEWGWFLQRHRELSRGELAELAVQAARASLADVDKLEGHGIYRFSFEGMATEPKRTLSALLEHLGLDPETYPWEFLRRTRYTEAYQHWRRVPEIAALRERHASEEAGGRTETGGRA